MSRWAPDAALRLERAALELFAEQGYGQTTVPQIAARAGLTTRTFFRHFVDKRDVLFLREREFPDVVSAVLAGAPRTLEPLDLAMHGFGAAAVQLEQWRSEIRARRAIIRSDEHLRERELLKSAALADAIERAMNDYGVDPHSARLVAAFSVLVFDESLYEWLSGPDGRTLGEVLDQTRERMTRLVH